MFYYDVSTFIFCYYQVTLYFPYQFLPGNMEDDPDKDECDSGALSDFKNNESDEGTLLVHICIVSVFNYYCFRFQYSFSYCI